MHRIFLAAHVATALFSTCAYADEATQVGLENGELVYTGELVDDANQRLFALYDSLDTKPSVLRIKSVGGVVDRGMDLAYWVHEHKLDVKVPDYCLSSCANYVFPAGRRKIVGNSAMVGFHGGISSAHFSLDEASQAVYDAMSKEQQAAFWASLRSDQQPSLEREQAFFKLIGVRQELTTHGQAAQFQNDIAGVVWTYTEAGFGYFGVTGIEVIDGPWRPSTRGGHLDYTMFDVK